MEMKTLLCSISASNLQGSISSPFAETEVPKWDEDGRSPVVDDVGDDGGEEAEEEEGRAGVNDRMQHLGWAVQHLREIAQLLHFRKRLNEVQRPEGPSGSRMRAAACG